MVPNNILILAPHPDDEALGCGGFLSLYGKRCDVFVLTDGRKGYIGRKPEKLVERRKKESMHAMSYCGVRSLCFMEYEDCHLIDSEKACAAIDLTVYDWVLIPNREEMHPDHKCVYSIFSKLKQKQNAKCLFVEYEVWTPLLYPNYYCDISSVSEKKRRMLECYDSQTQILDYSDMALSLNRYRGIRKGMGYAEAFQINY